MGGIPPGFDGSAAVAAPRLFLRLESGFRHRQDEWRIDQDFLAILAHEFVAHVGSIAATKQLEDFCDDPPTGADFSDSRELACSIRVENQVRRELNRALGLKGDRALPLRTNYSLEVMNFARAHLAQMERGGR
ncbi:MAG: hypothetical protein PVJ04_13420 [Gemmatimonadota bacterium]